MASKGQEMMIADGLPASFAVPQELRDRSWKGRKLTALKFIDAAPKEDPAAKQLRREIEAAAKKKQAERFARLNEAKQTRAKQAHQPEGTDDMAKTTTKKTANAPRTPAAKSIAGHKAAKKATNARQQVRATVAVQDVADFIARPGGASMAELVEKFGMDAHPMRTKIFNVRHTLGYTVEIKDGRYVVTKLPKGK